MPDVQGTLELRPGSRSALMVATAAGLGAVVEVAVILISDAPTVPALIMGPIVAVLIILGAWAFLTARITLTSDEVVVRGPFIRRRRPRSRITKAVRATIEPLDTHRGLPDQSLFLLDAHDTLLLRVRVTYYKRQDVDRLVKMLAVPCSGPHHFGSAREFDQTYPGLLSSSERHQQRIVFAVIGVLCAVPLAVVLVLLATAS